MYITELTIKILKLTTCITISLVLGYAIFVALTAFFMAMTANIKRVPRKTLAIAYIVGLSKSNTIEGTDTPTKHITPNRSKIRLFLLILSIDVLSSLITLSCWLNVSMMLALTLYTPCGFKESLILFLFQVSMLFTGSASFATCYNFTSMNIFGRIKLTSRYLVANSQCELENKTMVITDPKL